MDFYKKPQKKGFYLLNYGDCVVDSNIEQVYVYENNNNELEFIDKNGEKIKLNDMSETSWKWFPASELFKNIDNGNLKIKKTILRKNNLF